MRFVKDSFLYEEQEPGLIGMYKQIEKAARICYKTEDMTTDDSYERIINKILISRGHTSPLEFGTVYLYRFFKWSDNLTDELKWVEKYKDDRYSRVITSDDYRGKHVYITTTYRTIIQGDYKDPVNAIKHGFDKDWKDDLKYWSEPMENHQKRYCYRFVMDRVGSQSVMRHRGVYGFSFCQESTRYCNYSKDRFNGELTFVLPSKFYELVDEWSYSSDSNTYEHFDWLRSNKTTIEDKLNFLRCHDRGWCVYEDFLKRSEDEYIYLTTQENWKPEDARGVLPLDIKTEFLMCAYPEDWEMFFFRRCNKHAHPHIQRIAKELKKDFINRIK